MYIPTKYLIENWDQQEALIKKYPLATVVTTGPEGLYANHFPFFLHQDEATGKKYLHAHIAKKNPQVPLLLENDNVLVIFQSHDSYISPSYYPGKQETHKYVPTWDFAAVHIKGKSRLIDDAKWVRKQLNNFTDQNEAPREKPWQVDEAPEKYLEIMQKAIIGLEIEIEKIESKFKFEQKMKKEDIEGVVEGLAADGITEVSDFVKHSNT